MPDGKVPIRTKIFKPGQFEPVEHESKFIIEGILGKGGMGTIYDAYDRNIRRKVAIKSINEEMSDQDINRRYFTKEAQITGQLEHPNIIPVYEMGVNPQGRLYYVMKRVEGTTLADVLDAIKAGNYETANTYNLGMLLSIFQKVCDAIAYAHARGVVHLDLKPENIMLGDFGEVLILDWGIARLRRRSANVDNLLYVTLDDDVNFSDEFESEQVIGTPAFMAPEQATGQSKKIGTRTDVYSLGAILYNILTLRPPAAGKTTTVIIKKIVTGRVKDPMAFNEENNLPFDKKVALLHIAGMKIPGPLSKICMMAMNEQLGDRYQKVSGMLQDLNAYLSGYTTKAEEAGLLRRAYLYVWRHKFLFLFIVLLIIINLTAMLLALKN